MNERITEQEIADVRYGLANLPDQKRDLAVKMLKEIDVLKAEKQRLFDLVRHQRMELLKEDLITTEEYTELALEHSAVARIETYDEMRRELCRLKSKDDGVGLIAAERQRQLQRFNWTPEHDDQYQANELADAALCYLKPDLAKRENGLPYFWPWGHVWWKPTDRITDLVKAGALIAAEIDRLKRRQATANEPS